MRVLPTLRVVDRIWGSLDVVGSPRHSKRLHKLGERGRPGDGQFWHRVWLGFSFLNSPQPFDTDFLFHP